MTAKPVTVPCEVCITSTDGNETQERDCGKPARINVNGFPMCAGCFAGYEAEGLVESVESAESRVASSVASAGDGREVSVYDMPDADYERLEKNALVAWRVAYSKWAVDADNEEARGETFDTGVSFTDAREAYTDGYRTGYLSALESVPAAKPVESLAGWIPVGERLPDYSEHLLWVQFDDKSVAAYPYTFSVGTWFTPLGNKQHTPVVAWKPCVPPAADNSLPAPPEES